MGRLFRGASRLSPTGRFSPLWPRSIAGLKFRNEFGKAISIDPLLRKQLLGGVDYLSVPNVTLPSGRS
jgi:hypothetical protein